jgi:vesicle coat complex subunit
MSSIEASSTRRIRIVKKGYESYKKDTNHTKRIRIIQKLIRIMIKGYDVQIRRTIQL